MESFNKYRLSIIMLFLSTVFMGLNAYILKYRGLEVTTVLMFSLWLTIWIVGLVNYFVERNKNF